MIIYINKKFPTLPFSLPREKNTNFGLCVMQTFGRVGGSEINLLSVVNLLAQNLSAYCFFSPFLLSNDSSLGENRTHGNIPMSLTSFKVAAAAAAANACVK